MKTVSGNGWRYYNHSLLPATPPHIPANTNALRQKGFWKEQGGNPILARWISEWDCGVESNWWYVIKDTPFDLMALKSKRRYEIRKGIQHFNVIEIDPKLHKEEIFIIQEEAYKTYPKQYRPIINRERVFKDIDGWSFYKSYGAFDKETGKLVGYSLLNRNGNYVYYAVHKVIPTYESKAVNAAIIYHVLVELNQFLSEGGYICDGSRNVLHQTKFQDYLEKYFGFRKAYCKLHCKYRFPVGIAVSILYLFRSAIYNHDNNRLLNNVAGVLRMEEIIRSQNEEKKYSNKGVLQ